MGNCCSIKSRPTEAQQVTKYRHPKKKSIRPSTNPSKPK